MAKFVPIAWAVDHLLISTAAQARSGDASLLLSVAVAGHSWLTQLLDCFVGEIKPKLRQTLTELYQSSGAAAFVVAAVRSALLLADDDLLSYTAELLLSLEKGQYLGVSRC